MPNFDRFPLQAHPAYALRRIRIGPWRFAAEAREKGARPIICSPASRNTGNGDKIDRGFDGYAQWAAAAAAESGAFYIDLNALAADRYDALGSEQSREYFNDNQHTRKSGARVNAEAVVEGIRQLKDCPLADALIPAPASR
jgi:lysophospholipase L1-like esterase